MREKIKRLNFPAKFPFDPARFPFFYGWIMLGAGDIFRGAFCFYYANGHNFTNSLQRASMIAGASCQWFGTRKWMKKTNDIDNKMNLL